MKPAPTSWQRRRSNFNHNWLKNHLISALESAKNLINGQIIAESYLQEVLNEDVYQWQHRRCAVILLVDSFENEMSPKIFVKALHRDVLSKEQISALEQISHQLWLDRYPVSRWLEDAREKIKLVDAAYMSLVKTQPFEKPGKPCRKFVRALEEFTAAARALSKAIEAFPSQILFT